MSDLFLSITFFWSGRRFLLLAELWKCHIMSCLIIPSSTALKKFQHGLCICAKQPESTEKEASLSQLWTHKAHTVIPFCVVVKDRTQIFVRAHLFRFTVTERCNNRGLYFRECLFLFLLLILRVFHDQIEYLSNRKNHELLPGPFFSDRHKIIAFVINVKWSGRILDKSALQKSASQDQRWSIIKLLKIINY